MKKLLLLSCFFLVAVVFFAMSSFHYSGEKVAMLLQKDGGFGENSASAISTDIDKKCLTGSSGTDTKMNKEGENKDPWGQLRTWSVKGNTRIMPWRKEESCMLIYDGRVPQIPYNQWTGKLLEEGYYMRVDRWRKTVSYLDDRCDYTQIKRIVTHIYNKGVSELYIVFYAMDGDVIYEKDVQWIVDEMNAMKIKVLGYMNMTNSFMSPDAKVEDIHPSWRRKGAMYWLEGYMNISERGNVYILEEFLRGERRPYFIFRVPPYIP